MLENLNVWKIFCHKFFFPTTSDIITYYLNIFARLTLLTLSLVLVVTAMAGFLLYIAYFKSREVNQCRLLNCLTGILAITYIIASITSFATIIRELSKGGDDITYGPSWRLIRIYTGCNTVLVFGELTLASLLNMYHPTAYLNISLGWKNPWTMLLNLILIFVFHICCMAACSDLGNWTGDCVAGRMIASGIYFFIPIMICQIAIFVDCKWGWKKMVGIVLPNNSVQPLNLGTNETNSELDKRKINTGFVSLMADTGMQVVMFIIWRIFGFQETIVLRHMIKITSLASVAVFWIVRDERLGTFARMIIKKIDAIFK